jgi:hypothetical protein
MPPPSRFSRGDSRTHDALYTFYQHSRYRHSVPNESKRGNSIASNFAYSGLVMALDYSRKQNRLPGLTS